MVDLVGDDIDLARRDRREHVAVGDDRHALLPHPVARGEMRFEFEILARVLADQVLQFLEHCVGLLHAAADQLAEVMIDLFAHHAVDGRLVDPDLVQPVGQLVGVRHAPVIGRRALQHGHLGGLVGHRRNDRRRRSARTDHHHPLAGIVSLGIPQLGMDQQAAELLGSRPVRHVGRLVVIIALAHPQEVAGEIGAGPVAASRPHRPELVRARPQGLADAVAIVNVRGDAVFLDHLAHVFTDRPAAGDRRANPRLEPVAIGIKIGVGPDPGVLVGCPGPAEGVLHFEDREGLARALLREVDRGADPGHPGPDDQHIEMGGLGRRPGGSCYGVHRRFSQSLMDRVSAQTAQMPSR